MQAISHDSDSLGALYQDQFKNLVQLYFGNGSGVTDDKKAVYASLLVRRFIAQHTDFFLSDANVYQSLIDELRLVSAEMFQSERLDVLSRRLAARDRAAMAYQIKVYRYIHDYLLQRGVRMDSVDYDLSGVDILAAVVITDASEIHLHDALPFGLDENPEDYAKYRKAFSEREAYYGFSSQEDLWMIGNAKVPLLWKLEAMGAENIEIKQSEGVYEISFYFSYEGSPEKSKKRTIYYHQEHISRENRATLKRKSDVYLLKASMQFQPAESVAAPRCRLERPPLMSRDGPSAAWLDSVGVGPRRWPSARHAPR